MASAQVPRRLGLRAGEWVQVRSRNEILSTLDVNGQLDRMPFMPEMLKYCGQRVKVGKRAHKTCDPVNGLESRRLPDAVHLEGLRCDGSAHAGCQAGCLLFWKEAWLKRVEDAELDPPEGGCSDADLERGTTASALAPDGAVVYVCQATQVAAATSPLPWWDLRQYWEDYRSGNVGIFRVVSAATFWAYHNTSQLGLGLGAAMRWAYDQFMKLVGGGPYPWRVGRVPKGERTPTATLGIQEGELVQIRSYQEILDTLDDEWRNRGLYFDAEMVPYTGGTFRVLTRVKRIIDEKTGRMLDFKNPALILDGVVCQARYAKCRKLCPRAYYLYWREIWVNRVNDRSEAAGSGAARASSGTA
jgi:hypothetical protein